MKTYTVIYRTGGTARCSWHKTQVQRNREDAYALQRDLEKAGYKALVHDTALLNSVGMPEGWEASA
jgi:hypothetical protein